MKRPFGSILVLVLFIMVVLSLNALSFVYRVALKRRSAQHRVVMIQLRTQAESAVSIALGRLIGETNDFDHPAEAWRAHRPLATEDWLPEWGEDGNGGPPLFAAEYYVIDEEGKLHLLYASSQALEKLGMSGPQIASLFDWIDEDEIARTEGAEHEYYLKRPKAHRCKNSRVELLDELLLVKDFGPDDYLGEAPNGARWLEPAEHGEGGFRPAADVERAPRLGWVNLLTVLGDGRINLNTAPRPVLETLPLSDGAVDQIIGFREFDEDSSGSLEDHAFRSETDIEQLQGLADSDRDLLKGLATFRSSHFRVFAQAKHFVTGLQYHLEVLVRVVDGQLEILRWKIGP